MQPIVHSSPTPTAPDRARRLVLVHANGSEPCSFREPSRNLRTVADDDRSDSELVNRALCGDNAAWSAIIDRHGELALALARRAGLSHNDAVDVAQSVFRNRAWHVPGGAVHQTTRAGHHACRALALRATLFPDNSESVPGTCREVPGTRRHVPGILT